MNENETNTIQKVKEFKKKLSTIEYEFTSYILKKMRAREEKRSKNFKQTFEMNSNITSLRNFLLKEKNLSENNDAFNNTLIKNFNEYVAFKKHKRKIITKNIAARNSDILHDVLYDERLNDDDLINIKLRIMSKKARWRKTLYCWNLKNLLYEEYKYLRHLKDKNEEYQWSDEILKLFVSHENVILFRQKAQNSFFINHLKVRQRASKDYVDKTNNNDRYIFVKNSKKTRKIFEDTLKKIIYDRLQKIKIDKKKTMMRIKSVRRVIEKLIEESYVIVVVTQQWNQNSAKLWHQTNVELLKFNRFLVEKNKALVEEITNLRELIDVLQNVINDFMTDTSIALQDLAENKLKFVENQFTSEHDDAKDLSAKNLTKNIMKNLWNHFDDDNVLFEE